MGLAADTCGLQELEDVPASVSGWFSPLKPTAGTDFGGKHDAGPRSPNGYRLDRITGEVDAVQAPWIVDHLGMEAV